MQKTTKAAKPKSTVLDRAVPHYLYIRLRGGRMTKVAGVVASFAPSLGVVASGVSSIALGAALGVAGLTVTGAGGAMAGGCTDPGGPPGTFICSNPADVATDTTQALNSTGNLSVTTNPGFGIDTSGMSGNAFSLVSAGDLYFNDQNTSPITGDVDGINANNAYNASPFIAGDLSITTTGDVQGGKNGIDANHNGLGNLRIVSTNVTGDTKDGIQVINGLDAGYLSIITTGDVKGEEYGIVTFNGSSENLSVTAHNVTGTTKDGIYANNGSYASVSALSINTSGDVEGGRDGIAVKNEAGGDLTITSSNGGDASVAGARFGLRARNLNGGAIDVTLDNATGGSADGINVYNYDGGTFLSLDINGTVTGLSGIQAINKGNGDLSITASGDVTGTNGDGIRANNYVDGSLDISVVNATGDSDNGIYARNVGPDTDDLSITATGNVEGDRYGIVVRNYGSGDLIVTADTVTGTDYDGIYAKNHADDGSLTITTTGTVFGGEDGIEAATESGNIYIETTGDTVSGGESGIQAISEAGNVIITATGTVKGTASGIVVGDFPVGRPPKRSGGDISITANDVSGLNGVGIQAATDSGNIYIETTGAVSGNRIAIAVESRDEDKGIVDIESSGSISGYSGIYAYTSAKDLMISTSGTISSLGGNAIHGNSGSPDGNIYITNSAEITVSGVDNGGEGIYAKHYYNGNIEIKNHGRISVEGKGVSYAPGRSGDVAGSGILASLSFDDITISNYAEITSSYGNAIIAEVTEGDLTITSSGDMTAGEYAIAAEVEVSGDLTITSTGKVSGDGGGISATNEGTGNLTVAATNSDGTASVSGEQNGIRAKNTGGGYVRIEADTVSGETEDGIYGSNDSDGSSLTIIAHGVVTGDDTGILARNSGTEGLTIEATNNGYGQVTATFDGINAVNENGGALSIEADNVRGENEDGIYAKNEASDGDLLTITTTGDVEGGYDGIYALTNGTGALTVTTNGNVSGGDTGIFAEIDEQTASETDQASPETSSITIDSTGSVTSGEFDAILAKIRGSGTIEIHNAATLSVTDVDGKGDGIDADIVRTDAEGNSIGGNGAVTITNTGDIQVVSTEGEYSSAGDGIDADIDGDGDMVITNVATITSDNGHAISADLSGNGSITIDHTGTLSGGKNGILAENGGEGFAEGTALSITSAGAVSGTTNGIEADNFGTGDLTITATDADDGTSVSGGMFGISAVNRAGGALKIDAQTVAGAENDGIYAKNEAGDGDLTITSTGTVSGGGDGISATKKGTGNLTVAATNGDGTATVSGDQNGIRAKNTGGGYVRIEADTVSGAAEDGIYGSNDSDGSSLTIIAHGVVTGDDTGILAQNSGTEGLTIEATNNGDGQVTARFDGINAVNENGGALSIEADNVRGDNEDGIYAKNESGDGGLIITSNGTVSGGAYGIYAQDESTGDLSITANTVTGGEGKNGITANNLAGDRLTITTTGTVSGGVYGLVAFNQGTGDLTINANDVSGNAGDGLEAKNQNGGALTISANTVTGADNGDGIYAGNSVGDGDLTITTTGTVSGGGDGIEALNDGSGDLTITSSNGGDASVAGARFGLRARNLNGGAIDVTLDNATGGSADGINVYNYDGGTFLSLDINGTVTGLSGIQAINKGNGDLSITASGDVTGTNGDGIRANNYVDGSLDISVVNATGDSDNGIYARNVGPDTDDLSITATGNVEGDRYGIVVRNYGSGDLIVTADTVTGTDYDGIYAKNEASDGDLLTITTTGDVEGGYDGIYALTNGTGALTVTTNGNVSGGDTGIFAEIDEQTASETDQASPETSSITIDSTGSVTSGEFDAILAKIRGSGIIEIRNAATLNVTVVDGNGDGIDADILRIDAEGNSIGGNGAVTITNTGDIQVVSTEGEYSSAGDGIDADIDGDGDMVITNVATITSDNGHAISADLSGNGSITIDHTGTLSGGKNGILAENGGEGFAEGTALSITSAGAVSGTTNGIEADNFGTGDLTITATDADDGTGVSGGMFGISAVNRAGGALKIDAQTVTSTENDGINAYNAGPGDALSLTTTGNVTGGDDGIDARNDGSGKLSVKANNVTGNNGNGIFALNNAGTAALSITTTGEVTGKYAGIDARNAGLGDLTVESAASVTGGNTGIYANNTGGGALSIEAHDVEGETAAGIYAKNDADGDSLTITTTGTVVGNQNGISAQNNSTDDLTVTVSGATSGTNGAGITTATAAGVTSVITLNDGADVSGTTAAIQNTAGDSSVFVNAGAKVSGATLLGDGSDTLTIAANADISAVTLLDGGDGSGDTLTLSGFDGDFGADLTGWEYVSLEQGTVFRPTRADFSLAGGLNIDATSTFDATHGGAGTVALTGNLDNGGTVTLSDDAAGDQITVSGDLQGAGRLMLDADITTGTGDRVAVEGDVTGTGQISVNALGTDGTPEAITLVTVGGSASADAFALASANATTPEGENVQVVGAFTYRLAFDDVAGEFAFTPFDANGNVAFNSIANVLEAYPAQLALLNTPGAMFQSWANRAGVASGDTGTATRNLFNFAPTAETALWFRAYGTKATYEGASSSNSAVDTSVSAFELGVDLPAIETGSGRLLFGASFAKQTAQSDIITSTNSGGLDTDGAALSLNALWQSDSQFYAGAQLRYSNFSSDLSLGGLGPVVLGTEGEGVAASIEIGKAFAVSERLTLVPQVQLTHSKISGDTIADPFGQPFVGVITDGTTSSARIGLRAEYVTDTGSFYGAVSYIHGLDTKTSVDYAGQTLSTELDPNRIDLRAGGQVAISDTTQLYGEINYQAGLADMGNDNAYSLSVGLKIRF